MYDVFNAIDIIIVLFCVFDQAIFDQCPLFVIKALHDYQFHLCSDTQDTSHNNHTEVENYSLFISTSNGNRSSSKSATA